MFAAGGSAALPVAGGQRQSLLDRLWRALDGGGAGDRVLCLPLNLDQNHQPACVASYAHRRARRSAAPGAGTAGLDAGTLAVPQMRPDVAHYNGCDSAHHSRPFCQNLQGEGNANESCSVIFITKISLDLMHFVSYDCYAAYSTLGTPILIVYGLQIDMRGRNMEATKRNKKKGRRKDRVPATAARPIKKVVIDFPVPLYRETEWAVNELSINRSNLIRSAVESFVADLRRQKLEKELAAGYIANASQARETAEDFAHVDADLL
jgi:hypothetical protein